MQTTNSDIYMLGQVHPFRTIVVFFNKDFLYISFIHLIITHLVSFYHFMMSNMYVKLLFVFFKLVL